mmetsp:Transcript_15622/g.46872  ORF Transcript_15622/g.46872 Transcript_15622/m.46872 type:complete len:108 (-) Transcript_15622:452-775(-)
MDSATLPEHRSACFPCWQMLMDAPTSMAILFAHVMKVYSSRCVLMAGARLYLVSSRRYPERMALVPHLPSPLDARATRAFVSLRFAHEKQAWQHCSPQVQPPDQSHL